MHAARLLLPNAVAAWSQRVAWFPAVCDQLARATSSIHHLSEVYSRLIQIAVQADPAAVEQLARAGEFEAVSNLSALAGTFPQDANQCSLTSIVPVVVDPRGHIPNQLQDLLLQVFGGLALSSEIIAAVDHFRNRGAWCLQLANCEVQASQATSATHATAESAVAMPPLSPGQLAPSLPCSTITCLPDNFPHGADSHPSLLDDAIDEIPDVEPARALQMSLEACELTDANVDENDEVSDAELARALQLSLEACEAIDAAANAAAPISALPASSLFLPAPCALQAVRSRPFVTALPTCFTVATCQPSPRGTVPAPTVPAAGVPPVSRRCHSTPPGTASASSPFANRPDMHTNHDDLRSVLHVEESAASQDIDAVELYSAPSAHVHPCTRQLTARTGAYRRCTQCRQQILSCCEQPQFP